MKKIIFLLVLTACSTTPLRGPSSEAAKKKLFQNVRIFDGHKIIPKGDVLIDQGKIILVSDNIQAPDAKIIDGRGKTLLPGFVDAHVHSLPDSAQIVPVFGVTTIIDVYTVPENYAWIKEHMTPTSADILHSGKSISGPNGHGSQYGFYFRPIRSASEASTMVDELVNSGSDYIKLMVTGGNLPEGAMPAVIDAAQGRKACIGSRLKT